MLEFLFSLLIMMIITAVASTYFKDSILKAEMADITSHVYNDRHEMMVQYNLNGTWPEDQSFSGEEGLKSRKIDHVMTRGPAIHVKIITQSSSMNGKVVTYRPAYPVNNPSGPVRWICGAILSDSRWQVLGVNRTNVEENMLPHECRDMSM